MVISYSRKLTISAITKIIWKQKLFLLSQWETLTSSEENIVETNIWWQGHNNMTNHTPSSNNTSMTDYVLVYIISITSSSHARGYFIWTKDYEKWSTTKYMPSYTYCITTIKMIHGCTMTSISEYMVEPWLTWLSHNACMTLEFPIMISMRVYMDNTWIIWFYQQH